MSGSSESKADGKTMRAAQYHPETKEVKVNQVPIPEPAEDDILVKIGSASLCHSDMMLVDGAIPAEKPVTMGHEACGYVQSTGANVKGFKAGDAIGFLYVKGCCFECKGCQIHNLNCENGKAVLSGFGTDGFFAEYALVDYRNAIILPEQLNVKTAAPIFCAGVTAYHAVNECDLKSGQWLAVVGCGGLGQLAIQYAKAFGFRVIGLDINDAILSAAKDAGADLTFNTMTDKEYVEKLQKATKGGADAVAVFSAAIQAYEGAPKIVGMGGVIMVIGLPTKPLQFNSFELMRGLYRIKSTATGPPYKMPPAIEFTAKHNIQSQVSTYELEQINEMIEKMKSGKVTGRMAVVF
ncbi:MAG: putative secondary metabolism biosynthetic enzyme [Pycnora praestabilis]|nr:MAG: putative secondary metabolism biosynthetic enzyme [Pycnora praestabilis]